MHLQFSDVRRSRERMGRLGKEGLPENGRDCQGDSSMAREKGQPTVIITEAITKNRLVVCLRSLLCARSTRSPGESKLESNS